jgi:drug/metabolite transporter (DMT)-like permease
MIKLELPQQTKIESNLAAIATLSIALLAVSLAPIFIRFSETELDADATVFNRLFIFVMVFGTSRGISYKFSNYQDASQEKPLTLQESLQHWPFLFAVGIISVMNLMLWTISLKYTSVAKSVLLTNLTPVFITLGSWLFLKKKFDNKFVAGLSIALFGATVLGLEDFQEGDSTWLGDSCATLSAVFIAIYFLMVEQLRNRFSATTILLWRGIIGSTLLLPIVLMSGKPLFPTSWIAWFAVIGLGLISEGFGQRLLADCMDRLSSGFISVFLLLEPIISAILAWGIFAESLSPTTWLGFIVVLCGIYLAKSSSTTTTQF